uniref:Bone morphogenetic protein 9 n=1 Tax=Oplegnathus fasciatus TaxID=163134 RepID=A0A976XJ96_OPLFA|nr:bone morphogenetic protein 9 [Oplegnathus fasciatus]
MGADIRTVVLALGISIFKPCHRKVCFQAGKKSEDPEGLYSQLSEEDLLEEEDTDSRMENLLGTMKEGFLRKLNLSDVPQEHSKIYPPQFMMELYNKYASDSSTIPQSDVIRSFTVQGQGSPPTVSRPPVKVYEVDYRDFTSTTQLLVGKEVTDMQSTWETLDVTTAIQSWIKSGHGATVFEVVMDRKGCGASKEEMGFQTEIPEAQHPRRKKRKAEREYCRRTSLKVNFKDIGWDSWIVAPPEYDAFECRGLCYHPLTDEMTPSKHALIQTLINIRDPKKANMACCVPIKLDPITVMYQENGRLTIRYLYEEMKVAECGCR